MRKEYRFSVWELYVQIAFFSLFAILVPFQIGIHRMIEFSIMVFFVALVCNALRLWPIRAIIDDGAVEFQTFVTTTRIPLEDIRFARSQRGIWLYYRGGKYAFSKVYPVVKTAFGLI